MTTTPQVPGHSSVVAVPAATESPSRVNIGNDQPSEDRDRSLDSRFLGTTADFRRGYVLADRIYVLKEPWRARFVELIESSVDVTVFSGPLPSRTQIAVWLCNQQLANLISMMLRVWTRDC